MSKFRRSPIWRFLAPQSLRYQLLSRSLFILAGLLLLIGIFQYVFMQQFIYSNKASVLESQIRSIPDVWFRGGVSPGGREGFFFPDATVSFLDQDGNFTTLLENERAGSAKPFPTEIYADLLQPNRPPEQDGGSRPRPAQEPGTYHIVKDDQGIEQLVVLQPVGGRGGRVAGIVQVNVSTRPLKEMLLQQLSTFIGLAAVALVAGVLTFLPILRRTLVPLSSMISTVEQIDAGRLDERLATDRGQTEIVKLSKSFNRMLERLETSFTAEKEAKEQMRQFIADASHELRTPLTSIHGFLEVLLRGAASQPQQLDKALRSMYGESERLNKLVRDLLLLARLDRTPALDLAEGDLAEVIRDMEPQLHLLAGQRQLVLDIAEAGPDFRMTFDRDKMKQVILNLFHNAVQHTDPANGVIRVALTSGGQGAFLDVEDNGHGIAEEHLPHLFDRFYRADASRARRYGGSGLGLAITSALVELHGGTIEVHSRVGDGTHFRITLPASHRLPCPSV